ncbi:MAG: IMPACT family protein [bacterium]
MFTLVSEAQLEEEQKKSRFIAHAAHVETPDQAMKYLNRTRVIDATHNCWAYRVGNAYRFSDDGEPSGSAGKPILAAIDGQKIDQVIVNVVRYFGGTKLGVGGLVRAYSSVTANCLRAAKKCEILCYHPVHFVIPFSLTGDFFNLLKQFDIKNKQENYISEGVMVDMEILSEQQLDFQSKLTNLSKGLITFQNENQKKT